VVGGLRCLVIYVKYHPNRLRGYGAVGVQNGPSPLLLTMAYTTACRTRRDLQRQLDLIGVLVSFKFSGRLALELVINFLLFKPKPLISPLSSILPFTFASKTFNVKKH